MLLPEVAGRVVGRLAFVVRLHRNNTPLLRLKLSKLPPPVGKKKHRRASRHRVAPPTPLPCLFGFFARQISPDSRHCTRLPPRYLAGDSLRGVKVYYPLSGDTAEPSVSYSILVSRHL